MRLQGNTALVTGAGRGIGRAVALALAEEGADVVLASRTESELTRVADEVRSRGVRAIAVQTDLTHDDQLDALVERVFAEFGALDILVNNAGVAIHYPIAEIPTDVWDRTMSLNVRVPFLLTRAFWDSMVKRGGGLIVNVSSTAGKAASAENATYSASKAGLLGFTEALMKAGRLVNIRAVAVCPGPVATVMRAKNNPDEDPATILKPEDIAQAVVYVATQPPRVSIRELLVDLNPSGVGSQADGGS